MRFGFGREERRHHGGAPAEESGFTEGNNSAAALTLFQRRGQHRALGFGIVRRNKVPQNRQSDPFLTKLRVSRLDMHVTDQGAAAAGD
jgi:hypothetical protein